MKSSSRSFEGCDGCSFYFLASLIKNLLVKTVFTSYFLTLPNVSLTFATDMFLIKDYLFQLRNTKTVKHGFNSLKFRNGMLCNTLPNITKFAKIEDSFKLGLKTGRDTRVAV